MKHVVCVPDGCADEPIEELGVTGVPFFAIDRRVGVAGAQDSDSMLITLRRAWEKRSVA